MSIPKAKKYVLDFEQMGFGMFVHWGLYSQLGRGEWALFHDALKRVPSPAFGNGRGYLMNDEYKKLMETFTAEDFDAEKLVLMAKDAGCKYITLTTRHHDGFSLYDTCGLNDFDAPHSPAGRDLVREFVDACNKHGIMPMFYHTTLDWSVKDFEDNFDAYLEYLRKSVEVLCTNYGKIGGLWFDGNWSRTDDWKVSELYATIRRHQPEAMIIDNTGLSARGELGHPEIDSVTHEQGSPDPINREGMSKYVASESCFTINDHWGIGKNDLNYKSPKDIIETLCKCRRAGANLLLNIGPEGQGGINPYQEQLFKIVGDWMKIFGEAIYNGRPYAASSVGSNFILKSVDGRHLYFMVFDLDVEGSENVVANSSKKSGAYAFGNVADKITSLEWMDNGEKLEFSQSGKMLTANFTGYHYGTSYIVRVAKAEIAE